MRYNKDFIAETLAETVQATSEETRRRVDVRGVDTRSSFESMQPHNFRETSRGQAEAERLRDQNQVEPSIPGATIV